MRQVMLLARAHRAGEDLVVGGAAIQRAADVQQLLAGAAFQLAPELVTAAQQGHVGRIFVIGEADDARQAVGGAHFVGDAELFEAEDALAAAGEVVECRATHTANAEDDSVPGFGVHWWVRAALTRHRRGVW